MTPDEIQKAQSMARMAASVLKNMYGFDATDLQIPELLAVMDCVRTLIHSKKSETSSVPAPDFTNYAHQKKEEDHDHAPDHH